MRAVAVAFAIVLLLPLAGAARTSWHADDAIALGHALLDDPAIRQAADARAPLALRIEIVDGASQDLLYAGQGLVQGRGQDVPAYTLRMTTDAALVALNAADPQAAIRCLIASGAIAIDAPSATERIAVRAAHDRIAEGIRCAPPAGATLLSRGVYALDGRIYDAFGGALGWQDRDAARWLGRADAGISRLAPDEIPRGARADLTDPWRAANAPAIRALLDASADCPCEPPRALLPAGDWRAQLAADPRAQEGSR